MRLLGLAGSGEWLSVLCLGAHADDIEIGAGATILGWVARGVRLEVHWAVLSATGRRREEAHASAKEFLADTSRARFRRPSRMASFRTTVPSSRLGLRH